MVGRLVWDEEVAGSIPVIPTESGGEERSSPALEITAAVAQ